MFSTQMPEGLWSLNVVMGVLKLHHLSGRRGHSITEMLGVCCVCVCVFFFSSYWNDIC